MGRFLKVTCPLFLILQLYACTNGLRWTRGGFTVWARVTPWQQACSLHLIFWLLFVDRCRLLVIAFRCELIDVVCEARVALPKSEFKL